MFSSVVLWFSPIEESLHGAHHDGACFAETLHPSPNLFASSLTSVADVQKPRSEKERQLIATLIEVKQFTQKILPSI